MKMDVNHVNNVDTVNVDNMKIKTRKMNNPYDLNEVSINKCIYCGGVKIKNRSPYEPIGFKKICHCGR
jgi:hypothetical protein